MNALVTGFVKTINETDRGANILMVDVVYGAVLCRILIAGRRGNDNGLLVCWMSVVVRYSLLYCS